MFSICCGLVSGCCGEVGSTRCGNACSGCGASRGRAKVSSSSGSVGPGAEVNDGAGLGSGSRGSGILRPDTTVGSSAASSSWGVGAAVAWKETSGACDAMGSVLGFSSPVPGGAGCCGALEKPCDPAAARVAGRGLGFGVSTGTDCSVA